MTTFAIPKLVTNDELHSGTSTKRLIPSQTEIPADFMAGETCWNEVACTWLLRGMKGVRFSLREGVELKEAMRHLAAIFNSYHVRYVYREAAVAYLMSLWFSDARISLKKGRQACA